MFLHIGEGKILSKKDIVGIFDLENTSISKKTREFLKINDKKGNIEYISYDIPKTFIITKNKKEACRFNRVASDIDKNKKEKNIFVSQISSQTLYKRAERIDSIGTES